MPTLPTPPRKTEQPPTFDAATEAELDAAAVVTPADIARAQQAWRTDAAPQFRDLLDATSEPPAS